MKTETIKCVVVDDEMMARSLMESYVEKTPFLELLGSFGGVVDVLPILNTNAVDLVFLDIQMPDVNGLELSRMIPKHTRIIFTTAFDKYALEGFKVDALDYLLKPFDYQEFLTASNKALEWFSLIRKTQGQEISDQKDFIFIKSEYKQVKIVLNEVLYFEGWRDYVKIWLIGESKPLLTLTTLKALEEQLPLSQFMRIHRSFIVALGQIREIERSQVIIGNERITVAEQYKPQFHNYVSGMTLD